MAATIIILAMIAGVIGYLWIEHWRNEQEKRRLAEWQRQQWEAWQHQEHVRGAIHAQHYAAEMQRHGQTGGEVVKVRCRYCGNLSPSESTVCQRCGASL